MTANSPRAFGRQLRAARVTRLIAALLETGVGRYATPIVALSVAAVLTVLIVPFHLPRQVKSHAFLLVIIGSAWWGWAWTDHNFYKRCCLGHI
jgi:hypothetical protein